MISLSLRVGLGLALLLSPFSNSSAADKKDNEHVFYKAKSLMVKITGGDVTLMGSESAAAVVRVEKESLGSHCKMTIKDVGGVIVVDLRQAFNTNREVCTANFFITIPQNLSATVKTGNGKLTVNNLKKNLNFRIGSGSATINADLDNISGSSGSGDISIRGFFKLATVKSGSGHVRVEANKPMTEGNLNIMTGSGNADVLLPENSKVSVTYSAGRGILKNDFPASDKEALRLQMKAGSGNLNISKLKPQ